MVVFHFISFTGYTSTFFFPICDQQPSSIEKPVLLSLFSRKLKDDNAMFTHPCGQHEGKLNLFLVLCISSR